MLPMPPRLIVIGDVHGDVCKLMTALKVYKIIGDHPSNLEWVADPPNTVIVQLGDQLDSQMRMSGSNKWEVVPDTEVLVYMDNLDMAARAHGGRVISLIGNHELMNVLGDFSYVSEHCMALGGGHEVRRRLLSPGGEIAIRLAYRPAMLVIGDIVFTHAGVLPSHISAVEEKFMEQRGRRPMPVEIVNMVNNEMSNYLLGGPINQDLFTKLFLDADGLIWTRKYSELTPEFLEHLVDDVNMKLGTNRVVVGHTVVEKICSTCNGKVWFTDVGISRAFGDKSTIQVLNIEKK
jgi:hypothetical protein